MIDVRPLERRGRLKDLAYQEIKKQLHAGTLRRDSVYSAAQFAEVLGISRTPAREALLQLVTEGHLVSVDNRGFRIKEYSEKEIRDFFEARRLLETHVIEHVAGKLDAGELSRIDDNQRRMGELAAKGKLEAFLEIDREFHTGLVRKHNNMFLESVMDRIRSHFAIFGLAAISHPGRVQEILREHHAVIHALHDGSPSKAAHAMRDHLLLTEKAVLGKR
jgi:DNA-binding GntR family transcriptional regulator